MKRYAIARVKYDNCPIKYMIPKTYKNRCILHNKNCEQCGRNGDTKEQLIRKVAQIIKRELKGNCVAGLKDTVFVMKWCVVEKLAKKIVEFLGVK